MHDIDARIDYDAERKGSYNREVLEIGSDAVRGDYASFAWTLNPLIELIDDRGIGQTITGPANCPGLGCEGRLSWQAPVRV